MESKSTQTVSKKFSPVDIKNKDFRKVVRGYSPREVVEFLDEVARTWEKVQKSEKTMMRKIETLTDELNRWRAKETELRQIRDKALAEAEEIKNQASKEAARAMQEVEECATGVRRGTEEWLARLISELEETQRRKNSFVMAFKASLDSHYKILRTQEEEDSLGTQLTSFLSRKNHLSSAST